MLVRRVLPVIAALWLSLFFFWASAGCEPVSAPGDGSRPGDDSLRVVATTGMVGDVSEHVVGEHGAVEVLIKPGVDPHLYKPTRADIAAIRDADIVFYNGLLLEGKMTDTLIRAATSGKPVFAVTELIDESTLIEPEGMDGHADPHVWMDPALWRLTVGVIRERVAELAPRHAESFARNAEAFTERIDALDAYATSALESVPESSRVLVTAHDAFNYFGRRFGYEVVGIQGISTESEAGVRDIERLVELIVDRGVAAVFVESTVSDRNIRALIDGAAARGHEVVIGGELFSDATGEEGTYRGTYVGMIDHNVTTIVSSLGGTAPESGMNGALAD